MSDKTSKMNLKRGSGRGLRIGIVVAKFNADITGRLRRSAEARLKGLGVTASNIVIKEVPGALELPLAALYLAGGAKLDAVICLGCVIRGETSHYDLVCTESARGVVQVGLDTGVPCIYGVVTCENTRQALARSNGGPKDSGKHGAEAAVSMALLLKGN